MEYIFPDYYRHFQCTADQCQDTCCAGWQITVDKKSMNRYKLERGPYRWQLWRRIHWLSSTLKQRSDLRCAFLNEDNLCNMHTNLGPRSLCNTCRLYPRHMEEFEGVREVTLSISCPEVAKYLMNRREPVTFKVIKRHGEEAYEAFDPFLFSLLEDTREVMIGILQQRELSISVRMQLILDIAHNIQERIDQQNLFSCSEILEQYESPAASISIQKYLNNLSQNTKYTQIQKAFKFLNGMERLRANWTSILRETADRLYSGKSPRHWQVISYEFNSYIKTSGLPWDIQTEQLLVYFISTYFCGAVYDGNIYARAKMATTSVSLIEELLKCTWLRNEKELCIEDVSEMVYRYSREIEHSDKNLKRFFSC